MSTWAQTPLAEPESSFPDTVGHWAKDAIEVWVERGLLKGSDGMFRPNDPISRAELAAVLSHVIGYTESGGTFADVPAEAWYYDDIAKLYTAGIMQGDGGGVMRPTMSITREEAAVLFAKAFNVEENAGNESPFPDAADISGWAGLFVDGMKAAGYLSGDTNGNFNPKDKITRAEAVTILNNMCTVYYGSAGEYTGDVEGNVVVSAADVTLRDMKISGDLYIMEGVGDGDVILENVVVTGRIFARGGGANSLYIKNCTINSFVATKDELHIVFSNGTKISFLLSDLKDGTIELLDCTVETMTVIGDGLEIKLDGKSSVATLNADANHTKIQGEDGTSIGTANLNGQTEIAGKIGIEEANIAMDGCTIEQAPEKTNLEDGVKAKIDGKEETGGANTTPPATGGSGGGGGGNDPGGTTVTFLSHDVADMEVALGTAFEALGLPAEANLTPSSGSAVLVNVTWAAGSYDKDIAVVYTIEGTVAAKTGVLPSWAPAKITVEVTVKDTTAPVTFKSHNVPNKPNVPYNTAFDQLALPAIATLTASDGGTATVDIVWDSDAYSPKQTDGPQDVTGEVSAKPGETLPAWAPATISVSITVQPMPTPTTVEICASSVGEVVTDASIVKGGSESYFLRVKDANGTVMTVAQLEDAEAVWVLDTGTAGITINRIDSAVTIEVASDYSEESYLFAPRLTYTCNDGGEITANLSIATPEDPSSQVAAVTNVELVAVSEGSDMPLTLHIQFKEPEEITGIQAFEVRFYNLEDDNTPSAFFRTYAPLGNKANHEFGVVDVVSRLSPGTYKVEVVSLSQIDERYNNSTECDYLIEHTSLGMLPDRFVLEQATYGSFEGGATDPGASTYFDLFIDYHYFGMLVPEDDTLLVSAYFLGASRFAPLSLANAPHEGKGRLRANVPVPVGAQVSMSDFRLEISRYTLDVNDGHQTVFLATSDWVDIAYNTEKFVQMDFEVEWPEARASYSSDLTTIVNKTVGTAFSELGLPATVTLYAVNGPSYDPDVEVEVLWESDNYNPSSTKKQSIKGYILPDVDTEYPAWVPEEIAIEVWLQS